MKNYRCQVCSLHEILTNISFRTKYVSCGVLSYVMRLATTCELLEAKISKWWVLELLVTQVIAQNYYPHGGNTARFLLQYTDEEVKVKTALSGKVWLLQHPVSNDADIINLCFIPLSVYIKSFEALSLSFSFN